jgi:hypothetical protein
MQRTVCAMKLADSTGGCMNLPLLGSLKAIQSHTVNEHQIQAKPRNCVPLPQVTTVHVYTQLTLHT